MSPIVLKKKRLLFVIPELVGGGAEHVACTLMNSFVDKYDITLFAFEKGGECTHLLNNKIQVIYGEKTKNKVAFLYNNAKMIYCLSKKNDVTISVLEMMPTFLTVLSAGLARRKVIAWVHTHLSTALDLKTFLKRVVHEKISIPYFYNHATKIITVSHGVKEDLYRYLSKSNRHKVVVIYNPFDIKNIKLKSMADVEVSYFGHSRIVAKSVKELVAVGRLSKEKDYELMIDSCCILKERGYLFHLNILGEGPMKQTLRDKITTEKLDDYVSLLGYMDNPYPLIRQADALIMSSSYEGLPSVIIEAMILETPVVAINCPGGISELLDNGASGMLINHRSDTALAEGIEKVLVDQALREYYIKNANRKIASFDTPNVINEFSQLIDDVIKKN